jgi:hypothetical protein
MTLGRFTHVALMGDLVDSEEAPSVQLLHEVFNAAIYAANRDQKPRVVSPLTITLGDEFQGLYATLSDALAALKLLRARLLLENAECRFALGLVRLETPLNTERAWNMMGPGLADTREKLSDKRDPNAYRFHIPENPAVEGLLEAVGACLSDIEHHWTERQRQVVLALRHVRPTDLALQYGLGVSTLYKIRRAGRFDLYERQWAALEGAARSLDEAFGPK